MADEQFNEVGAEYFIYDQRFAARKDSRYVVQYYMGGKWVSNENLTKNWDTLADGATKAEVDAFIVSKV